MKHPEDGIARGEWAENTERKEFTVGEALAITEALKPYEEAAAKARLAEGQKSGGRGKKKLSRKKRESKHAGEVAEVVAKATGSSAATLAKVHEVAAAAGSRANTSRRRDAIAEALKPYEQAAREAAAGRRPESRWPW